jgi:outer membrane protein TolC
MESHASIRNGSLLLLALAGAVAVASPAAAQSPPPPPAAPPVAPPPLPAAPPDTLAVALAPKAGGLTPEAVAKTVSQTKHSVRSKQADLQAAAAKVDQAFVNYFPKVSLGAGYTRLSNLSLPNISFAFPGFPAVSLPATSLFPIILNNYSLTASLAVPVSDYLLRLTQGYAAASHNEKSARAAAEAEALQAGADAKIAYFNWVRAKGSIVVSQEAIDQASAHYEDVKKQFAVGYASKADVLRVDAQVAAAQQALAESQAFAAVAEEQLRILLGAPPGKSLEIGADVMNEPASPPGDTLAALQEQAMSRRLELRVFDEAIASLKQVESLTHAGYFPRLDAFADATYANPNQRYFPPAQTWVGTWDVGVKLSWTLNDTFTTIGASAEAKARTLSTVEQKANVQDGLRTEVASAYADSIKAPATISAADRGMVSAEESLRVRRELFRNGKSTSTEVLDAEGELTQARLRRLDAHIGLLVARARLDHAIGRDAPPRAGPTE